MMSQIMPTLSSSSNMAFPCKQDRHSDNQTAENRLEKIELCMRDKVFKLSKPLVVCMSIFGLLFLRCNKRRASIVTRVYSIIVLLVMAGIFVQMFFSYTSGAFVSGSFLNIITHIWHLHCFLNALVTFKACNYENRFVEFLIKWSQLLKTNRGESPEDPGPSSAVYEQFMKRRFNLFIAFAWFALLLNISSFCYMIFYTHLADFIISPMSPTHPLALHVKVVIFLPQIYMTASWILPLSLFMLMSSVIYKEFEIFHNDLKNAIAADENLLTIEYFRLRHQSICQFVETADDILSGFNFSGIFLSTCEGMLILYSLVWSPGSRADPLVAAAHLIWLVAEMCYLLLIAYGGGYLNHMAHAPLKSIYDVKVKTTSPEFSLQMNMFLSKLTGESIGLTALDMFVIDKPTLLTIAGAFVTYFIVIIQFKQPASTPGSNLCNCTDYLVNSTLQCTANSWY